MTGQSARALENFLQLIFSLERKLAADNTLDMSATHQVACTCSNCGVKFDVVSFRRHPSYRVQPDVAGDLDAVLLGTIDCQCVAYGKSTLSIELTDLEAALAAYKAAA